MKAQLANEDQNTQPAAQLIEACTQLTGEEKAALLKTLHELESKLSEKDAQLRRAAEAETANTNVLEKALTVLEQKTGLIEEQNRELQIEESLERVRVKTMAMQSSNELSDLVLTVFKEFIKLDLSLTRCAITVMNADGEGWTEWTAEIDKSAEPYDIKNSGFPYHRQLVEAWGERKSNWVYELAGSEMKELTKYLITESGYSRVPEPVKEIMLNTPGIVLSHSFGNFGYIRADSFEPVQPASLDILYRFAKVFDLTYTRFLDLQKAEAQAREARVEAALEKVRSRSLSMHYSDELKAVVEVVFEKLQELDISFDAATIDLFGEDTKAFHTYFCGRIGEELIIYDYHIRRFDNPVINDIFEAKESGVDFHTKTYTQAEWGSAFMQAVAESKELQKLAENIKLQMPMYDNYTPARAFGQYCSIVINNYSTKQVTALEKNILIRFTKVFEQAYIRFLDLQRAEASAREAVKQTALDRIRAEIASMRTTNDLERITPLVWKELTTLDVPFIRCGVFIVNEAAGQASVYLSTPDGQAIAAFQLPFSNQGLISQEALQHWRSKEIYTTHWDAAAFSLFIQSLIEEGVIKSTEKLAAEIPPESLYLHFVPFDQGMLYVGNTEPLTDDELQLAQSLADAFATAYARYDDFSRLEAAKQQIERTLSQLRSAQAQLIQSEKMASLGELTAGIAHEIQNPLNFVNNFSETNQELLEELQQEVQTGNVNQVQALVADIRANEEKITHHGKRADSIVKNMLQHSRSGSGEKLLTDINALADEYLRLAYHGFRAKDNSFDSVLETLPDMSLGKVNVVPQDMGRVLLNLYNNAFYAANAKKHQLNGAFQPVVQVSTKRADNHVVISVRDNGTGMSRKVADKVFQPFFTTKPTGEGTGLGLSLSYDIVTKGHGGTLSVESKEGEGSEFVVTLPA